MKCLQASGPDPHTYVVLKNLMSTDGRPAQLTLLASERSERDTIRGVQIRAGAVYIYIYIYIYIYMYGGTYTIIVAHDTHT